MGTTPNFAIPYPELTDPPDGAGQLKALAQRVDVCLITPVYCAVEQSVVQNIPQNAYTALLWDLVKKDTHGMWTAGANGARMTCRVAGTYVFTGGACLLAGAGTKRQAHWNLNGASVSIPPIIYPVVGAALSAAWPAMTLTLPMIVGDYVDLRVFHDNSAALNTGTGVGSRSYMSAFRLGP